MRDSSCEGLRPYLDGSLPEPQRAGFEVHLADCPGCRQVVREEQCLDELLTRAIAGHPSPTPALVDRIEGRLRRARRQRFFRWGAGVTAAMVLVGWFAVWREPPGEPPVEPESAPLVQAPLSQPDPEPDPRSSVQVTIMPEDSYIARPLSSGDPAVTIIWLYPTIQAGRTSEPESVASTSPR